MLKYTLPIAIAALFAGHAQADHRQYDMRVDGLTCPFCVATSSKSLKKIDGVYEVAADLDTGIISVCAASETALGDERMAKLFRSKGFTYRGQTIADGCTITDISHSETGENLTEHDHPHPPETPDEHAEHGEDDHKHEGHGS